jgi:hypothetical protein
MHNHTKERHLGKTISVRLQLRREMHRGIEQGEVWGRMTHFICKTCGTQFAASDAPPERCPICEDERQYIGWEGQEWTTLEALQRDRHNVVKEEEPGLTGIGTHPSFAIGQRALLVQTPGGNL